MADGGPPAQHIPHASPAPSAVPTAAPAPPAILLEQPVTPPAHPGPVPQLNWSHFKLQFSGKPDQRCRSTSS